MGLAFPGNESESLKLFTRQSCGAKTKGGMASSSCTDDLTCSICQTISTDPVAALCGHSICRRCNTDVLNTEQQCTQCRTAVEAEGECLPTSVTVESLIEKAKEALKIEEEHTSEEVEEVEEVKVC